MHAVEIRATQQNNYISCGDRGAEGFSGDSRCGTRRGSFALLGIRDSYSGYLLHVSVLVGGIPRTSEDKYVSRYFLDAHI